MQILNTILPSAISLLALALGYFLAISRSSVERAEERRDDAIDEVFGSAMTFYRNCVTWASTPTYDDEEVRDAYRKFLDTYYYRTLWLGKDNRKLVDELAQKGKEFVNKYVTPSTRKHGSITASDWRKDNLLPAIDNLEDALQKERDARRSWWRLNLRS